MPDFAVLNSRISPWILSRASVQASPILNPECLIRRTSARSSLPRSGIRWVRHAARILVKSVSENGRTGGSVTIGALITFAGFFLIQPLSCANRKNDFRYSNFFPGRQILVDPGRPERPQFFQTKAGDKYDAFSFTEFF